MKYIKLALCLTFLILCACNSKNATTIYDKEIPSEIRTEIDKKVDIIWKSIAEEDLNSFKEISSEILLKNTNNLGGFLKQISIISKENELEKLHMYYTKAGNIKKGPISIYGPSADENSFNIYNMEFLTKEKISVYYKTDKTGNEILVFLSFGKYEKEWKCDVIQLANYSFDKKNAVILNKLAKLYYIEKQFLTSSIYSMAMKEILNPIQFLGYKREKEYNDFHKKIITETNAKIKFPIVLKNEIEIFLIDFEIETVGVIPSVKYVTTHEINKTNSAKLIREAKAITNEITEKFPELKNNFKKIQTVAYDEFPDDKNKKYSTLKTITDTESL